MAWDQITSSKEIYIGKGKKVVKFAPSEENKDEILQAAMGRSGNLRAPTIKTGTKMYIGYNDEMYQHLIS